MKQHSILQWVKDLYPVALHTFEHPSPWILHRQYMSESNPYLKEQYRRRFTQHMLNHCLWLSRVGHPEYFHSRFLLMFFKNEFSSMN